MSTQLKYSQVENYLRTFSTLEPPYDFGGLLHLVLASVENLREHATDQDLLDFTCAITDEQTLFLRKLLDTRAQSITQIEQDP